MTQTPGVCGRFFGALGRAGINVLAVSQGSSERNISAVKHAIQYFFSLIFSNLKIMLGCAL